MIDEVVLEGIGRLVRERAGAVTIGRLVRVAGMLVEAHVPGVRVGDAIEVEREGGAVACEVVGFRGNLALAVPLGDLRGVTAGARVHRRGASATVPVSEALIGRAIDVFGRALDGGPPLGRGERVSLERAVRPINERARIGRRFDTGVRVIDGLLTAGWGQRVGVFAGAGVGKTMLIRQLIHQSRADVVVVGLIGERGCEVRDLLESEARRRCVIVAATSDRPPLERARGAHAATAIAEHFRDRGRDVLLVIDSLTRYAMALREIGLAAGELPATKGYPASVFAALPRLLERVLPLGRGGSITGFYSVLVEGDDLADPVADCARSLLDGHIVLSRELAARGHFPAVDVLASASRVARQVTRPEAQAVVERTRALLAVRREAEELRSLGAYVAGASPEYNRALALGRHLDGWLRQGTEERVEYEAALAALASIVDGARGTG